MFLSIYKEKVSMGTNIPIITGQDYKRTGYGAAWSGGAPAYFGAGTPQVSKTSNKDALMALRQKLDNTNCERTPVVDNEFQRTLCFA